MMRGHEVLKEDLIMVTKNTRKNVFKQLATAAAGQVCKYVRLTEDSIAYGNFVVTVRAEGYEAFRKEGYLTYVPVSFHCEHSSGYAHEIWEGMPYSITKREVSEHGDEAVLWEVLWNIPHLGHYEFDPYCI